MMKVQRVVSVGDDSSMRMQRPHLHLQAGLCDASALLDGLLDVLEFVDASSEQNRGLLQVALLHGPPGLF